MQRLSRAMQLYKQGFPRDDLWDRDWHMYVQSSYVFLYQILMVEQRYDRSTVAAVSILGAMIACARRHNLRESNLAYIRNAQAAAAARGETVMPIPIRPTSQIQRPSYNPTAAADSATGNRDSASQYTALQQPSYNPAYPQFGSAPVDVPVQHQHHHHHYAPPSTPAPVTVPAPSYDPTNVDGPPPSYTPV